MGEKGINKENKRTKNERKWKIDGKNEEEQGGGERERETCMILKRIHLGTLFFFSF